MNDEQQMNSAQGANPNDEGAQPNGSQNGDYAALQMELIQTQEKLKEMMSISQRALADLQNFRRRAEEEKASFIQYANAELMLDLIPVLDNANRALAHEPKDAEWAKGVEQTLKIFIQTLEKRGLKPIPTTNQKFDPKIHEALLTGPGEKDMVTDELEKGFMLGDKVIKRARVKVGDGTPKAS